MLSENDPLLKPTHTLPNRDEIREKIVQQVMEGATPSSQSRPKAVIMGGGGGSGKTTVIKMLENEGFFEGRNYIRINSDDIKEMIPEYQKLKEIGDPRAASVVHQESSLITQECLNRATSKKCDVLHERHNIVYDGTLSNMSESLTFMEDLRQKGYEIILIGVTVKPEIALDRAQKRGERTGRYVPDDVILNAHKGFSKAFPILADVADKAYLYDNNQTQAMAIAQKENTHDTLRILDQRNYEDFRNIQKLELSEIRGSRVAVTQSPGAHNSGSTVSRGVRGNSEGTPHPRGETQDLKNSVSIRKSISEILKKRGLYRSIPSVDVTPETERNFAQTIAKVAR